LVGRIQRRVAVPETRTDWVDGLPLDLGATATSEDVKNWELELGYSLYSFHKTLVVEVGNGGFGPGWGMLGFPGGHVHDSGSSVIELARQLWHFDEEGLPIGILPLCDWGDATWSCVRSSDGRILTLT